MNAAGTFGYQLGALWSTRSRNRAALTILHSILTLLTLNTSAMAAAATIDTIDTLSDADFTQASQNGFVFALNAQNMPNSQCATAGGSNNGVGKRVTATSSQGNAYGNSRCRHRAFQNKTIANGWRVQSVTRTQTCEQNTGSGWQTLSTNPSACEFTVYSQPQVGSNNLFFQADTTVWGNGFNQRRARLDWTITIARTQGISSPWVPMQPGTPTLGSPADNSIYYTGIKPYTFTWSYSATAPVIDTFTLCIGNSFCNNYSSSTTQGSPTLPGTLHGTQQVWSVKACNAGLCTNSSGRTINITLPAPALTSPANNATPSSRSNIGFNWGFVFGAQGAAGNYKLTLSTPAGIFCQIETGGNPGASLSTCNNVPAGQFVAQWSVQAKPGGSSPVPYGAAASARTITVPAN